MSVFRWILIAFLMPGDLVIKRVGISIEEDGGILRSFVNMCFWGLVTVLVALFII
ncbi:hypothetical protein [Pelagibius sp. Alg239-R121]|uniref:hypothetical protein n=1 Tax=Pelagibius sp. Alg239-R121 TaxID=2993448 RepID=UPI0024A72F83|nr:hypothetical protein [Pelagibius sp. Alg239-R121]